MQNTIQIFSYNENPIGFDLLPNQAVMINATEMAKPFDKKPIMFLRTENTEKFIDELLQTGALKHQLDDKMYPIFTNWTFSEKKDLVITKDRSNTWMHPVLAMNFAFWLNPMFSAWLLGIIMRLQDHNTARTDYLKAKTKLRLELEQMEMVNRRSEMGRNIEEKKNEIKKLDRQESTRTVRYIEQELPLWFPESKPVSI